MQPLRRFGRAALSHFRHPGVLAFATLTAASAAIMFNALLLQPRPHPAPYFSTREASTGIGEADELVRAIQNALKQRGFYSGSLDGVLGPQTRSSITAFERSAGRRPLGEASTELLEAILSADRVDLAPATLQEALADKEVATTDGPPTAPDPVIAAVQRALARAAYGPVGVDGFAGPQTYDAIMRFQRDHNLPVTGEISDSLLIELRAAGALGEE
jgi:peptidoglycan hydrolase-like protein with peptidoglycan-binding domain